MPLMRCLLCVFGVLVGAGGAMRGQETPVVSAAELARTAVTLRGNLETLAREMEVNPLPESVLRVRNASTEDLRVLATALFRRSQILVTERLGRKRAVGVFAPSGSGQAKTYSLLAAALSGVREVNRQLQITESGLVEPVAVPVDLYAELSSCNRLLLALLPNEPQAGETYRQLTQAVGFAVPICLSYPGQRISPEPAVGAEASMPDLFAVLLSCFELQQRVAEHFNVALAEVGSPAPRLAGAADVDELSMFVLTASGALYRKLLGESGPPWEAVLWSERTLPQVVQRAGLLDIYLERILKMTSSSQGNAR